MKFNSILLKIMVNFYGLLGNQLHPLERSSLSGYFHLVINLVLNAAFIYYTQNDLFLFRTMMFIFEMQAKPLFSFIVRIFLLYAQQILLLVNFIYSFWCGPQMTYFLNSPSFNTVSLFNDPNFVRYFTIVFMFTDFLFFYISYRFQIVHYFNLSSLYSFGAIFVIFTFSSNIYLHLHMLFYWQYGTLVVLRQLKASLSLNQTAVHKVRLLALTNNRLYSLISLPLTSFFLLSTICIISTIGMYSILQFNTWTDILFAVFPVAICVYIVFIVHFNEKVLKEFDCIYATLIKKQKQTCLKNTKWSTIKMSELEQYRNFFQLRLFGMVKIDYSFLLALTFFILNLVVFLVQTK